MKKHIEKFRLMIKVTVITSILAFLVSGCAATKPPQMSDLHLKSEPVTKSSDIPALVSAIPTLPAPQTRPKQETYTVVVNAVPARELLFSLARDAKINIDIHPNINGQVSLNAIEQTLPQILDRIARQVSLRYHLNNNTLVLEPDTPYWRTYAVDYVNMDRDSVSETGVATEISTTGGSVVSESTTTRGNLSSTRVKNVSSNHFWKVIEENILAIVTQDKMLTSNEVSPVVVNALSSVISVYASDNNQQQVQHFLDQALDNALRQVLIEMTIVEVELSDLYQAGIDWQNIANNGGETISAISNLLGANLVDSPVFSLSYQNNSSSTNSYSATLKMLETFGDVQVLSSPKIMALNNQTALLKVVDEKVYFTINLEIEIATNNTPERRTYISEIHTVPVGLVMSVTPQINAMDNITLNIRPTISRITGYAIDPAPRLQNANFENLIPEIQVREMESLLQVANGQMVVMGGLMQNKTNENTKGVPLLSKLPFIGSLFRYENNDYTKSELVIFLKPTVIKGAGAGMDLQSYDKYLTQGNSKQEQISGAQ